MRSLALFVLLTVRAFAGDFYVSPSGNDAASGDLTHPWQTISRSVKSPFPYVYRSPGDTVYIRGGVYSGNTHSIILNGATANSGTAAFPITMKAYPGETAIIADVVYPNRAITMYDMSWWRFENLIYSNNYQNVYVENMTNCVWTNCVFGWMPYYGQASDSYPDNSFNWASFDLRHTSQSNIIINCTFRDWGNIGTNVPTQNYWIQGTHFKVGEANYDWEAWYNLIQGCTFARASHDLIECETAFNIFRGNLFHMEPWISTNAFCHLLYNSGNPRTNENPYGAWSARIMKPGDGGTYQIDMRNVFENNLMYYTGAPADSPGGHGIELGTRQSIYRNNCIAFAQANGIFLNTSGATTLSSSNAIYNNTIYACGIGYLSGVSNALQGQYGIYMSTFENRRTNNYIVNNILWNNGTKNVADEIYTWQQYRTNWNGDFVACTDPQFISTNGVGFTYNPANLPNFQLKSTSPCINAGTWLAYIASDSGSGTSFTVDNSLYFSDGNHMVQGDTIQLQGQTTRAVITANDWTNNVLTFTPSLTWTNGQGVSLAYNGTAPDMGAYEFSNRISTATLIRSGTLRGK